MKLHLVSMLPVVALSLAPAVALADIIVTDKIVPGAEADPGDRFGQALAVDGASVIVGFPLHGPPSETGAVDIFEESGTGGGYGPPTTLSSPIPEASELFGSSVGIDGTAGRAAVGAPGDDTVGAGMDAGSVSIYEYDTTSGNWQVYSQVFGNPEQTGAQFGTSLSMQGDRFVVGAPRAGSAHVFTRNTGIFCEPNCWVELGAPLAPSSPQGDFDFGAGVDLSGACERIVVASPLEGFFGAAYVFAYNLLGNDTWDLDQVLDSPNPLPGGQFGGQPPGGVAVTCDYVAVAQKNTHQVWVFRAADYGIDAALSEPGQSFSNPPQPSFAYGSSIDLSGERLVVGDPDHDTGRGSQGVVHYYQRVGAADWRRAATFAAPDASGGVEFGAAVQIEGNRLFIGAPGENAVYYVDLDTIAPIPVPMLGPAGFVLLFAVLASIGCVLGAASDNG
jgi:hypothetical protein